MVWTEAHDVQCTIEILARRPYAARKGSNAAGKAWKDIADVLNKLSAVEGALYFCVDGRSVSDHNRNVMTKKWNEKNKDEQNATGGGEVVESEFFNLMRDIQDDKALFEPVDAGSSKEVDKLNGEKVRRTALEKIGETRKRDQDSDSSASPSPARKSRRRLMTALLTSEKTI